MPTGEVRTVCFERDVVPFGYHDEDALGAASGAPRWTALGDIGYVDADGYVHLTDRKAFMIFR